MAIVLRTLGILLTSSCLGHRESKAGPLIARLEVYIVVVVGEFVLNYTVDSRLELDAEDYGYQPDKFYIEYRTF